MRRLIFAASTWNPRVLGAGRKPAVGSMHWPLTVPGSTQAGPGPEARRGTTWPGLTRAGTVLLPNGWSLKPAGRQTAGRLPGPDRRASRRAVLAILHAGYGEHEVVTVDAGDGQGHRPGRAARDVLGPGLVGRRQAALRRRRVRRRRSTASTTPAACSRTRSTLAYPEPTKGRAAGCPAGLARLGATARRSGSPTSSATPSPGSTPTTRQAARPRSPSGADSYPYGLAWDEAERPALREPLGQAPRSPWSTPRRARSSADGRPRSIPTRCSWRAGARSSTSPTPTATPSSVFDTEAGKAVETIGTAIDPEAPPGCTPSSLALSPDESILFVANANTNDLAVVNVKEPGASTPLGFIPTGWYPTSVRVAPRRQDALRRQRQGGDLEGQPRRPEPAGPGRRRHDPRVHRRALPGDALDHPDARPRSRWRPTRRPSTSAARSSKGDPTAVTGADAAGRATRSRRRSATRRRSRTASTSSRRTAPTTRSSATCPRATASPASASSPRRSRPTTTPWPASSSCSTTSTSTARSAPTATSGRWGPTPPTSSSGPGRWATGATAACRIPPRGRSRDRPARRRLPLGPRRGEGRQLPQLRRVRRERHDARRPRHHRRQGPPGALRPDVPQLRPGLSRRRSAPTGSSRSWPGSRRRARCPG